MSKIYHVCPAWDGDDLLSLYQQIGNEAYDVFQQKYELDNGVGFDHAHLHCHYTLQSKRVPKDLGGQILEIDASELEVKHDALNTRTNGTGRYSKRIH